MLVPDTPGGAERDEQMNIHDDPLPYPMTSKQAFKSLGALCTNHPILQQSPRSLGAKTKGSKQVIEMEPCRILMDFVSIGLLDFPMPFNSAEAKAYFA